MKNKFKKLTSLLLASIMMLVALPIQTLAAEWGKGDTVYAAMIGDFVGSDGKTYADKYNYDYIYYKSDGSIGKATRYASTHAKLGVSKNGIIQPAICIEAGVAYNTGSSYVPKKSWVSILGLIAVRGNNLFETLMLNYNAESDSEYDVYVSTPSWEKDNNKAEFNTLIPVPDNQAALLSLMSRRVYLCRENGKVNGYYISGGDYFEEVEVFGEQMTLWRSYKEKGSDSIKYKPQLHKPSTKAWQEFGSIAALEGDENSSTARKPGVIAHIESYIDRSYLDNCFLLNVTTASVIHDFNDSMCFKIVDSISDELSFHSDLLMKVGEAWRYRIGNEIGKCESAAKAVNKLSINLQKSAGASGDKLSGEDAKTQFYSMIDKPFRDWLSQLDTSYDIDEYTGKIEDTVRKIAIVFGNDCVHQMSANTIFGRYEKDGKDKNLVTTVEALNIFNATINKIFRKEGDNK